MISMARCAAAGLAVLLAPLAGSPQVSAQVSDGVVKIGILNDQSGVYADFGGKWSVEAARMAVEDFGGKVLNVPIEIVNADHQNKPDVASNIARHWYDVDKVDAIMDAHRPPRWRSPSSSSRARKKKVAIVTGAATTDLTGK